MGLLIALNIFAGFFMTGLIWLIQLVHYPGFAYVGAENFGEFHAFHSRRITWIVLPVMSLELLTTIILVYLNPDIFWSANLGAVLLIWACTAFLSVPLHNHLNGALVARLTRTNWPRTILWTARSVGLIFFMSR